ncbi:MAG: VOC family protein [Deltaproteobacteria bacterium]|nr:VOC family protein [Deltaproteobacteria bacterium]
MRPTPKGWPRISSSLYYEDANAAIDFLCRAFGFEVRLKIEGDEGRIEHSELVFGDAVVMVGSAGDPNKSALRKAPSQLGGANTQNMFGYVDDVEAHCKRAREAGAKITMEPKTSDYGEDYWSDRTYEAEDIGGHRWWFAQRMSTKGRAEG